MRLNQKTKLTAIYAFLLLFLGLFGYYIKSHPAVVNELKHINVWLLVALLIGYGFMLLTLMAVNNAILSLCSNPLKIKENLLLTIYSTLTNFIMPLQSGIGVRTAYVKRRHKVSVSSYIVATLIYFTIYAIISSIILFATGHYILLVIPGVALVCLISYLVIRLATKHFERQRKLISLDLSREKITRIVLITLIQILLQAVIYYIELRQVSGHAINPLRAISYTGAANFSLFVALTPGAIGFREAFLAIAHRMHGFSGAQIVAANIIDRGVFLVFIGTLFVIMLSTHAKDRITPTDLKKPQ